MSLVSFDFSRARTLSPALMAAKTADRRDKTAARIGLLIVTVLPAAFWTGVVWALCAFFGIAITGSTLVLIACGIALFLAMIGSALMASH